MKDENYWEKNSLVLHRILKNDLLLLKLKKNDRILLTKTEFF